ncbi:MAG: rod shape-determining protein RodA [Candidatus Cloacimonetes bacterium]|nr:rod shape-determining protein RodA [Candidatus Cloacimonadota bacterium]MCF7814253.1 rod shape-determining protein RodA [Candidatus Cloacimonadota bacterium]MCF7868460.1 rod shape-determining protein RodA [Candidatus Cloacimonadota bacterium]MCF7883920.1 rod shape-determining protein RodA [Candidatus Cloacimonadota bacterium]
MRKFDWLIFSLLICLLFYGVIAIYSASTNKIGIDFETQNYYIKQIIWIFVSLFFIYALIKTPYTFLEVLIVPAYIITIILLIVVIFMPEINGSHRWIPLGLMNFQPSELAKLITILLIAKLISQPYITGAKIVLRSIIVTIIPVGLIILEPDLGTALTILISTFAIIAVSDLPFIYLILIISPLIAVITSVSIFIFAAFIIILIYLLYRNNLSKVLIGFSFVLNLFFFFITPVIWNSLKSYQQNRILSFIDPMRDPFGAGYQIIQSKIAIGSGGFMGKGILLGTQKNMNFLPEHHTDFIFSVIGEEFGFFGCVILLLIYFLFLFRIAKRLEKLKRKEFKYATTGILAYLTFQIFVNIGMNIGIVPTTGIPLPFVSYGGSNLLINVMAVGFVLKFINERSIFK